MCSLNELLYLRKTNYCKYYALLVSVQTMVILFDSYEQLIVALIFFRTVNDSTCDSNLCKNGGSCAAYLMYDGAFIPEIRSECQCAPGWDGETCEGLYF